MLAADLEQELQDFPYVIGEYERPRIGFGSGGERFPRRLTVTQKREVRAIFGIEEQKRESLASTILHKYPSQRGYSALANRSARFNLPANSKNPAPNAYEYLHKEDEVKISYPFNVSNPRPMPKWVKGPGPSPCDYYHYRRREQPVEMSFGKKRYIIPAYAVFCGPENKSKCYKCQCRPLGDYYHNFDTKMDLCRPCMNAELEWLNNCKVGRRKRARRLMELGCFKPSRWCDFFHRHYAGSWLVEKYSRLMLRKKNNIENYLQSYDKLNKWYVNY